ncbi:fatty acid desaturase [Ruegeria faecimaris]|uniref:fatty acid desaturase n=1 Tax=Ruegeria faecimaris TaxID=686389 RepID=UPI002492708A|nr:fatty acid desaturase [Ruegeria faecimaris]
MIQPKRPPELAPKGIQWADLVPLNRWNKIKEPMLPLPWLLLSLTLYSTALWPLGAIASFLFFLCALRLNHEAIHGNLGLSRRQDSLVMHVLSAFMLGSNHAFCQCHLLHHKHAMGPGDCEGNCGHMTLAQVLVYGPRFPFDINRAAWRIANVKARRRILIDWGLVLAVIAAAVLSGSQTLLLHVAAMSTAQCLAALFAVWITHQGTHDSGVAARSQRGVLARLAYLMFYHREHHLFPKVPVSRLPVLADRLERSVAGYAASRKPVIGWLEPRRFRVEP